VRAVVAAAARLVGVAVLLALLERQQGGLSPVARVAGQALGGVLILWPFFTSVGRNAAKRIALGRAYVRASRWGEATHVLAPFARRRAVLFDSSGEGGYWLATSLREQGRSDAAAAVLRRVAGGRPGRWRDKAAEDLALHRPDP
jgi:hypothetical protein